MGCGCSSSSRTKAEVIETSLTKKPQNLTEGPDKSESPVILTQTNQSRVQDSKQLGNESTVIQSLSNTKARFKLSLVKIDDTKATQQDLEDARHEIQPNPLTSSVNIPKSNSNKVDPIVSNLSMEISTYLEDLYESVI
jgi:hypothetical protein